MTETSSTLSRLTRPVLRSWHHQPLGWDGEIIDPGQPIVRIVADRTFQRAVDRRGNRITSRVLAEARS